MNISSKPFWICFALIALLTVICPALFSSSTACRVGFPAEFYWNRNGVVGWSLFGFVLDLFAACLISFRVARFVDDPEDWLRRRAQFRRICGKRDEQGAVDLMDNPSKEENFESHADQASRRGRDKDA